MAGLILVLTGAGLLGVGWLSPGPAPPPSLPGPASGAIVPELGESPVLTTPPTGVPSRQVQPSIPGTGITPVRIAISALRVHAAVIPLGVNPDGTVAVPPLSTPQLTSWFDDGPAPGQAGPAAIFGHVDTAASGPAVFYNLRELHAGELVTVTRADGKVLTFTVYQVTQYPKATFPTMAVYGDTPGPELRLITCGGTFNRATGSYESNIVVYARLAR